MCKKLCALCWDMSMWTLGYDIVLTVPFPPLFIILQSLIQLFLEFQSCSVIASWCFMSNTCMSLDIFVHTNCSYFPPLVIKCWQLVDFHLSLLIVCIVWFLEEPLGSGHYGFTLLTAITTYFTKQSTQLRNNELVSWLNMEKWGFFFSLKTRIFVFSE